MQKAVILIQGSLPRDEIGGYYLQYNILQFHLWICSKRLNNPAKLVRHVRSFLLGVTLESYHRSGPPVDPDVAQ